MSNDITMIKQTLAAYCHRVDRGTADEVAALFSQDGILQPYYDGNYECKGRDAVRDWYRFYHEKMGATVTNLKHLITSSEISLRGDQADAVTYLTAYFTSKEDGTAFQAQGTYFDVMTREKDQWLFHTRRIEVEFITPLGKVIAEMAPMGYPH